MFSEAIQYRPATNGYPVPSDDSKYLFGLSQEIKNLVLSDIIQVTLYMSHQSLQCPA